MNTKKLPIRDKQPSWHQRLVRLCGLEIEYWVARKKDCWELWEGPYYERKSANESLHACREHFRKHAHLSFAVERRLIWSIRSA